MDRDPDGHPGAAHCAATTRRPRICVAEAARRALKNAHLEIEDIDLILVANNTPDTVFPATACYVQAGSVPGRFRRSTCHRRVHGISLSA